MALGATSKVVILALTAYPAAVRELEVAVNIGLVLTLLLVLGPFYRPNVVILLAVRDLLLC